MCFISYFILKLLRLVAFIDPHQTSYKTSNCLSTNGPSLMCEAHANILLFWKQVLKSLIKLIVVKLGQLSFVNSSKNIPQGTKWFSRSHGKPWKCHSCTTWRTLFAYCLSEYALGKTTQASKNKTLWKQGFSQRNAKKNQPDVNNSVQIHTTLFSSFISVSQRYRLSNVRS